MSECSKKNVSITLNSTTKCRNITIEEAQEVVRRERKNIFPLSSESDNKITI